MATRSGTRGGIGWDVAESPGADKTPPREAMNLTTLNLILGYSVDDRRHESEPTQHSRRVDDEPELKLVESDDQTFSFS